MNFKLILGFSVTIILLIVMGTFSIYKLIELSSLTQKMYDHPFRITNASKNIQYNIILMHNSMSKALSSEVDKTIKLNIEKVYASEKIINEEYKET